MSKFLKVYKVGTYLTFQRNGFTYSIRVKEAKINQYNEVYYMCCINPSYTACVRHEEVIKATNLYGKSLE